MPSLYGADVVLEPSECLLESDELRVVESRGEPLVERDHGFAESREESLALVGQLDPNSAAVAGVPVPRNEAALLESVRMPCERGPLDAHGAREIELRAPRLALERAQHEPDGHRAARVCERGVERAADGFRRHCELESDWGAVRAHVSTLAIANYSSRNHSSANVSLPKTRGKGEKMSRYEFLLFVHVAAVIVWLGTGTALAFIAIYAER